MLRFRGMTLSPGRAASQILRRSSVGRSLKSRKVDIVVSLEFGGEAELRGTRAFKKEVV